MTARPEHTPAYDSLVEQAEPSGPRYRVVHPEPAARRLNGHGHALARRAPQPIARATGRAPVEWIEPASRPVAPEAAALPRHALEATFAALAAGGVRAVLASSPARRDGTSSFVEAAGRAIAGSGLGSVVLVDADADHPSLHSRFDLPCARGLTEALDELYGFDISLEEGSQFGIGDWLEVLRAQGRTGQLTVRGDGRTWVIDIVRGRACALSSVDAAPASRLGERLLQHGHITAEQRELAWRVHEETARPLGEVLTALGFVDPRDLVDALQQQCVRGLVELIALRAPHCRFDERAESHVCGGGMTRLMLPGVRGLERLLRGRVLEFLKQPFLRSQTPSFVRDTDTPEPQGARGRPAAVRPHEPRAPDRVRAADRAAGAVVRLRARGRSRRRGHARARGAGRRRAARGAGALGGERRHAKRHRGLPPCGRARARRGDEPGRHAEPAMKRLFDIVLSALGLLLTSPLLLLSAIAVRLGGGPGPVLFRQQRIGRGRVPFTMLKFRTMVAGADQRGPGITVRDDARVTAVGRLLRDSKLDELPQLVNVLRGEMSLRRAEARARALRAPVRGRVPRHPARSPGDHRPGDDRLPARVRAARARRGSRG
jgi:hypothetical protein